MWLELVHYSGIDISLHLSMGSHPRDECHVLAKNYSQIKTALAVRWCTVIAVVSMVWQECQRVLGICLVVQTVAAVQALQAWVPGR